MSDPPLVVEPVIGFRTWLLTDNHELRGVAKAHVWTGQPAICDQPFVKTTLPRSHPVPHADCQCGYWLFSTYAWLRSKSVCWGTQIRSVRGVALGWGRTVVCEHGWRVQYAKPMALLAWPERRSVVSEPFSGTSEMAAYWAGVCERTADALGVPLSEDADELIAHAERLREQALSAA
jgi:hypothetical protein